MSQATHYPSGDLQGPFTAKVQAGHKNPISIASRKPFGLVSQAVAWCLSTRARLSDGHPNRRWSGYVYDRQGCLHQFAFTP